MKQYLLIIFSFVMFSLNAQLSIEPEFITEEAGLDTIDYITLETTVTNAAAEEANVWWTLDPANFTEGWDYQLCDKNLCYNWNFQTCPVEMPNVMNPGQSWPFTVKARHNGISGTSSIDLHITDANGDIIGSSTLEYSFNPTSNTENLDIAKLSIYPNPVTDNFQIRNDSFVAKVAVYNIVGKIIFNYNHIPGNSYDVTSLDKGVYLVRLFDENDGVLNVFRLNKN